MKTVLKAVGIIALIVAISFAVSCGGGGGGGGGIPNPKNPNPQNPDPLDPQNPESEPESMIEMVLIPVGSFWMGSPVSESGRYNETQHQVTFTKGFKMGKYPVTQEQYERVMGVTISEQNTNYGWGLYGEGSEHPMYYVNWYEAVVFCNKLSVMEGLTPAYRIDGEADTDEWAAVCAETLPSSWDEFSKWNEVEIVPGSDGYRLPTEAQWEYACRGDYANKSIEKSTKPFGIGDGTKITGDMANFDGTKPYNIVGGEYDESLGSYVGETTPVGSYEAANANSYGLYDMHGNVYEWCWDWSDAGDYPSGPATDPVGATADSWRVIRGGYRNSYGQALRSASRYYNTPSNRNDLIGFRVVRPD